jgi:hypothetical protein
MPPSRVALLGRLEGNSCAAAHLSSVRASGGRRRCRPGHGGGRRLGRSWSARFLFPSLFSTELQTRVTHHFLSRMGGSGVGVAESRRPMGGSAVSGLRRLDAGGLPRRRSPCLGACAGLGPGPCAVMPGLPTIAGAAGASAPVVGAVGPLVAGSAWGLSVGRALPRRRRHSPRGLFLVPRGRVATAATRPEARAAPPAARVAGLLRLRRPWWPGLCRAVAAYPGACCRPGDVCGGDCQLAGSSALRHSSAFGSGKGMGGGESLGMLADQ